MKLYSENENYKLYQGNMLDMLEAIKPESIDSIVTDPPYELNFMGKGWDNSGIAFQPDTWKKCYEVLKPGGYLLAFGGSRTFHRIACAIEDAGFEIRDTIMWLYGSGFPKSMDISKQIDKRADNNNEVIKEKEELGNYLKEKIIDTDNICAEKIGFSPALVRFWKLGERIPNKETWLKLKSIYDLDDRYDYLIEDRPSNYIEAERKVIGKKEYTNDKNVMNISNYNGERVHLDITIPSTDLAKQWQGWGTALKPSFEPIIVARKPFKGSLVDNVIEYGVGGINIDECRVETNDKVKMNIRDTSSCSDGWNRPWMQDKTKDKLRQEIAIEKANNLGRFPANTILTYDETDFDEVCDGFPNTKSAKNGIRQSDSENVNCYGKGIGIKAGMNNGEYGDSGSASRYFMNCKYTGKDEEIWKQLLVSNVGNNLEILKATKDNIVQMNVEDLLKELKDHYAKYVANQQDLIETPIVQDIAEMLTWDFKIETSQVIQDFIINSKKCIQFLNLVQFVEKMDNIDTTQTTQNLLKLFGYVKVAITNYIQGNIEYDQKRYIYTPKASKKDRDEGLDEFEDKEYILGCNGATLDNIRDKGHYGNGGNGLSTIKIRKNTHPTVKPTDLMQYLVRLVTPNGGTVLDPFNGSGSTGKAVMYENKERNKNYKYIGIELTEEYLPIAKARIEYVCNLKPEVNPQMTIFDMLEEIE